MAKTEIDPTTLLTKDGRLSPLLDVAVVGICAAVKAGLSPEFIAREIAMLVDLAGATSRLAQRKLY